MIMHSQRPANSSIPTITVTAEEIELRKKWLEFEESDERIIVDEIDKLVGNDTDDLIENMYSHFLSFEETRSFFPSPMILKHAQKAQKEYFVRFTKGSYDEKYVADSLNVGSTHHRIDLDPKWYIGAYNRVLSWFLPKIVNHFHNSPGQLTKALSALMKLIFFDMGLAIECYITAKEQALRQHRDAIRELEMERRVTKSIMENAPTGIVSLNENFVCLECNDEFLSMVEQTDHAQVAGTSLFQLAPGLHAEHFEQVLSTGQAYRSTAQSLNILNKGLNIFTYWDLAVWPIKDEQQKVRGLVAMFANATDRVLLHQQREDFVATLTHDLKTPILATNRAVSYLIDGDFGDVTEDQKPVLQTILQSNNALYGLVQTLLDVYKFDSGLKELYISTTDIATVIKQLLIEIQPLALDQKISLTAVIPDDISDVECDSDEIRRVLQNLIDNSLKFTPIGGQIKITLTQTAEKILISVKDDGKGISEENKPKLFQRFWQAGSTGRHYASTGLGLYLCRRIIEAHAGNIWCESKVGEGSTFFVEIPIKH